jgi:cytochrome c553
MRLLLVVLALATAASDARAEARAGEKKAQLCLLCHRAGTQFGSGIALLEGRSKDSLVKDITDFKAGRRRSPAMDPNVERLTARDIEDIADYFSAQAAPAVAPAPRLRGGGN